MVVLRPMFDGERTRACNICTHVGLRSPVPERSSFYPNSRRRDPLRMEYDACCRRCAKARKRTWEREHTELVNTAQRLRRAERVKKMTPEAREAQRRRWREAKRRELVRDPEGTRKRWRESNRRNNQKRRENVSATAMQEERRDLGDLRRSPPEVRVDSSTTRYGAELDIRPFRAWIRQLIAQERAAGTSNPRSRVGARIGASERSITRWLSEGTTVFEATVDRAATSDGGVMAWEIYAADYPVAAGDPDLESGEPEPGTCATPRCPELALAGRFCPEHAERLAAIRADLQGEAAAMSRNGGASRAASRNRQRASEPTCCNPNCWNPRESGRRYCEACEAEGWVEEEIYD